MDAGDALFAHVRYSLMNLPSVQFKAEAFLEGMEKIGCDALNIGEYDLAGGYDFLKGLEEKSEIPFVSANLFSIETGKLAFEPYVIIKKNKVKVGVIGVTDYLSTENKDLIKKDYLVEGKSYIDKLRNDVDILVMLVNGKVNDRNKILETFKDSDYIYLSRTVMNTRPTSAQTEGNPIFYTIGLNGKQLVEVNTTITNALEPISDVSSYENRLSSIVRQLIRLKSTEGNQTIEEKYADNPQVITQIRIYEQQVMELESNIDKIVNRSECKVVSMSKNMDYDVEMQKYIDNVLIEAKNK